MDGLGKAIGDAFVGMAILALVIGAALAIALEHLVLWIYRHFSWSWS